MESNQENEQIFNWKDTLPEPIVPSPEEATVRGDSIVSAPDHRGSGLLKVIICLVLCAGALLCKFYYPAGNAILQQWIIGTGEERIQVAVSSFDHALQQGQPVDQAISVFYDEMTSQPQTDEAQP